MDWFSVITMGVNYSELSTHTYVFQYSMIIYP